MSFSIAHLLTDAVGQSPEKTPVSFMRDMEMRKKA